MHNYFILYAAEKSGEKKQVKTRMLFTSFAVLLML